MPILLLLAGRVFVADGAEPDMTPQAEADRSSDVAATVNGEPITVGAVNELVGGVLQGRPVNAAVYSQVQAEVLAQLIDRTLILQMLDKTGKLLPSTDITQAMEQVKKQAADQKIDFKQMLAARKLTEKQFRDQLVWQLNWGKFTQAALGDKALKAYFDANKREYDGSEVRVSHILLRPDGNGSVQETERLKTMAKKLRELIDSGKVSFEDAAKKYSAGPSRRKGGDLGFIPRTGLMLESFSAAAFRLEMDQLSDPVVTPYGVHLVKVTEIKPGRKLWVESKDRLRAPAAQALFEKLAAKERDQANVSFSGKIPHFRLGTQELAEDATPDSVPDKSAE